MNRSISTWLFCLAMVAGVHGAVMAQPGINWNDYRELDDTQLGHLRFIGNIAAQPFNDWSRMDSAEAGQGGFDAYRYQLAMMSYTLNLANYHYTPAYRDLHQRTTERLIAKMMRFDVWSFWEQVSQGAKLFDPGLETLSPGWRDPVIKQNIMYSGHLFQMVTSYAMLYDSDKYEKPSSLTFVFDPIGRGLGKEEFPYDAPRLAKVLRDQFADGGYVGIECEPNAIFVECNQHPILGFKLFDQRHGTGFFNEVAGRYRQTFDEQKFLNRDNGSFMRFKMLHQNKVLPAELPWNDGWAGIFMHAWSKKDVEDIYPLLKRKYVVAQADGTAVIPFKQPSPVFSWDNGFFAALATEIGDSRTSKAMLDYADRHWHPMWTDGGLYYPRNDEFLPPGESAAAASAFANPERFVTPRVNTLTGNALLGLARVNVKNGLYTMFSAPWTAEHFRQPYLAEVQYPAVYVSRAVYDAKKKALVATIRPSPTSTVSETTFLVGNLAPQGSYTVWINGELVSQITSGRVQAIANQQTIRFEGSQLKVATPLTAPINFVVMAR